MTQTLDALMRAETPPRENLSRVTPFALRATNDDGEPNDGFTLDGFAAVFMRQTIIDSWEGRFKEQLALGSMKRSFRETPPKIQFDHGQHPMVGSIPIAKLVRVAEEVDPDLAPDGGAHVIGRLHDNWLVQPVRDAIASESIDGMSFRFMVVDELWQDADGKTIRDEQTLRDLLRRSWMEELPDEELLLRTLRQLKVPELGPVVWPAYTDTSVMTRSTGSSKVTIDIARLGDPEERRKLAGLAFMAERLETSTTDVPADTQEDASDEADDHGQRDNDTQRATRPVGEHESPHEEPDGLRSRIGYYVRRNESKALAYAERAVTKGN